MSQLNLLSLHIENFKSFRGPHDVKLSRKAGVYLISGRNELEPDLGANGVGKTTIFDALLWVLWGKTGRDGKPGAAISPWSGESSTNVILTYARGERTFLLQRTRNPNSLKIGSLEYKTDSTREITQEEVSKLIGMSEEMFRRSVILGQFGTLFLDLKPDAQAQMFTEALALDVWLKASGKASAAQKDAQQELISISSKMESNETLFAELEGQHKEAQAAAKSFAADKKAACAKLSSGIERLEASLKKLQAKPLTQPPMPDVSGKLERQNLTHQGFGLVKEAEAAGKLIQQLETEEGCPTCGHKMNAAKRQKLVDEQQDIVIKCGEEAAALSLKIKALDKKADVIGQGLAYADAYNQYEAWTKAVSSTKGEISRFKIDLRREEQSPNKEKERAEKLDSRLSDLEAEFERFQKQKKQLDVKQDHAAFWTKAFKEIRLEVIDDALAELEIAATRHAHSLGLQDWQIKFETERETAAGNVSYKFTVLLYPPDQDKPIKWESYSGGEAQRWQLATAFALSEVLLARAGVDPNIEIYDEPTKGLSPEGISALLEALRDRAEELDRTIWLVDHHALDRGQFEGMLMVSKDKKGSHLQWL